MGKGDSNVSFLPPVFEETEKKTVKIQAPEKLLPILPSPPNSQLQPNQGLVVTVFGKKKSSTEQLVNLAEENCLARAVYFESRFRTSEYQNYFASFILGRVRTDGFPKSICGVIYEGASIKHKCAFSFACDGNPDEVLNKALWEQSQAVARNEIAGQVPEYTGSLKVFESETPNIHSN